jgi:hypothetical protein
VQILREAIGRKPERKLQAVRKLHRASRGGASHIANTI